MIHDFGTVYGTMLYQKRPDLIERIATCDIGMSPKSLQFRLFSNIYQKFFIILWFMGEPIGGMFLRCMFSQVPILSKKLKTISTQQNYSYYYLYYGSQEIKWQDWNFDPNNCPIWFGYGAKKPINFHSDDFVDALMKNQDKGCHVQAFDTEHWVMEE